MSDARSYEYTPPIRCCIKHLLEGRYNATENSLYTIFGTLKRVRIVATITNREEFMSKRSTDINSASEEVSTNLRFELDDGTGIISAVKWDVDVENFGDLNKGVSVDVLGRVGFFGEKVQINNITFIKKIINPNYVLLREADVIKKIKSGNLVEIPEDIVIGSELEEDSFFDDIPSDIDVEKLFSETESPKVDKIKEEIFGIIYEYSQDGNGISLEELQRRMNVSENKLRTYINDLVMESRIYPTEENIYQSY
ncbi:MAG TPA: hypothetical protein VMV43_00330 [Candidatus Nanopelagicaceae bacterium]|jgi:hypothetical protein|nr:hypothetical protein [Candidatus Nanopelagicaceae bacterium]